MNIRMDYANKSRVRKTCATKFNDIKLTRLERIIAFYTQIGDPE